jgi:hypothetical protein
MLYVPSQPNIKKKTKCWGHQVVTNCVETLIYEKKKTVFNLHKEPYALNLTLAI